MSLVVVVVLFVYAIQCSENFLIGVQRKSRSRMPCRHIIYVLIPNLHSDLDNICLNTRANASNAYKTQQSIRKVTVSKSNQPTIMHIINYTKFCKFIKDRRWSNRSSRTFLAQSNTNRLTKQICAHTFQTTTTFVKFIIYFIRLIMTAIVIRKNKFIKMYYTI